MYIPHFMACNTCSFEQTDKNMRDKANNDLALTIQYDD